MFATVVSRGTLRFITPRCEARARDRYVLELRGGSGSENLSCVPMKQLNSLSLVKGFPLVEGGARRVTL